MKTCCGCKVEKPLSAFYVRTGRKNPYRGKCKECERAKMRGRRRDPTARRQSKLKTLYGLAAGQYETLLVAQNGVCAICRTKPTAPLVVDHCHASGRVRGLLCRTCNTGIGQLRDNPVLVRAAASYLETA